MCAYGSGHETGLSRRGLSIYVLFVALELVEVSLFYGQQTETGDNDSKCLNVSLEAQSIVDAKSSRVRAGVRVGCQLRKQPRVQFLPSLSPASRHEVVRLRLPLE